MSKFDGSQLGPCQAIVDDFDHPAYHAPMQRIVVPGSKPCPRRGTEKVKHLCFCRVHARMAREGLIDEHGQVAPRADRSAIQRHGVTLHTWAKE